MKKRITGMKNERFVQKFLEKQGYLVHRAYASIVKLSGKTFTRSNDIFGLFDILAKKEDEPIRLIQVSTGYRKSEKEKRILEKNIWDNCIVEIWLYLSKGVWKIYRLKKNEFKEHGKIERGKYYETKEEI